MLFQEREAWEEKEQEYLQKIDEITNNHLRAIEIEKVRLFLLDGTLLAFHHKPVKSFVWTKTCHEDTSLLSDNISSHLSRI